MTKKQVPSKLLQLYLEKLTGQREYLEGKTPDSNSETAVYLLRQYNIQFQKPISKIGIAKDVYDRVYKGTNLWEAIASQYPYVTEIVAVFWPKSLKAKKLENHLHKKYSTLRIRLNGNGGSEWFNKSIKPNEFIKICSTISKDKPDLKKIEYYLPEPNWTAYFKEYGGADCFNSVLAEEIYLNL